VSAGYFKVQELPASHVRPTGFAPASRTGTDVPVSRQHREQARDVPVSNRVLQLYYIQQLRTRVLRAKMRHVAGAASQSER
jgi:hypothetical protein